MAWGVGDNLGSNANSTAGLTGTLTVAGSVAAGNVVVIIISKDNNGTTDADHSEVAGVVDAAGNTYVKAAEYTNGQGAADAGQTVSIWYLKVTNALTSGVTVITATYGDVAKSSIAAFEFTVAAGSTVSVAGSNQAVGDAADPAALTLGSLASSEYLWIFGIGRETENIGLTQDADYTAFTEVATSGGADAANSCVGGGYRIFTGTTDTVDAATTNDVDHVQILVAFLETLAVTLVPSKQMQSILQTQSALLRY